MTCAFGAAHAAIELTVVVRPDAPHSHRGLVAGRAGAGRSRMFIAPLGLAQSKRAMR